MVIQTNSDCRLATISNYTSELPLSMLLKCNYNEKLVKRRAFTDDGPILHFPNNYDPYNYEKAIHSENTMLTEIEENFKSFRKIAYDLAVARFEVFKL